MDKLQQINVKKWLPNGHIEENEKIILFLRRHWIILFMKYFFVFVLALIPIGVYLLVITNFPNALAGSISYAITVLTVSLYYLFVWISIYTTFIDYYLDVWIVTTHRIIDREQKGLFHVTISEQSLEQIQDVSSNIEGVIPTILEYGNVLIQSAAAKNLFHFKQIPEPDFVSQKINELAQAYRTNHR